MNWFRCTGILVSLLALGTALVPAEEWPEFRGPAANGHSQATQLPLNWSDTENIAWRTPLPGLGWSSPVVASDRIWLTSAVDEGHSLHAICLQAETGQILNDIEVFAHNEPKSIHKKNSHASPTPIIDGDRIYVHFGTYGTACLSADGEVRWRQKLDYEPRHGPGGSPVLFEDLLILNCDGTDVQFVVALDKGSGEIRWKTPRAHVHPDRLTGGKNLPMAFSTPTLWNSGTETQVLSAGADHLAGYDARTGREIWWSRYDGYSIVLRPTIAGDLVLVSSCYDDPKLYAVRLGGLGDVTETRIAWVQERGAPHNPSPLVIGEEVYLISDNGIATCVDRSTGQQHWQKRLGGDYSASPLYASGRIYALSEDGVTTVFAPGREYHELAKNTIDGRTLASLAVDNAGLLLRTDTELMRIASQP